MVSIVTNKGDSTKGEEIIEKRSSTEIEEEEASGKTKVNGGEYPGKQKRSKTFTGCFTCRSRKIRCDLTKPHCRNCSKTGLVCAGYDIKLRWSQPLQFSNKKGNSKSSLVVFNKKNEGDDENANPEFFQRRSVGFVKWDKPYETYDEMDRVLGILHNSGNDNMVNAENKTKLLGPFGVFKSSKKRAGTEDLKLTKRKNAGPNYLNAYAASTNPKQTADIEKSTPIATGDDSAPHDQLWLSNELRDDALLTAAALNGDSQFLDFMNNLSPTNNQMLTTGSNTNSRASPNINNYNFSGNQNDFLNLVFHRHNNFYGNNYANNNANSDSNTPVPVTDNQSSTNTAMSNLLNENDGSKTIDPSNQHLYYSNYNTYYYNNPYQLNENLEIQLHASKMPNPTEEESTDIIEGDHTNTTQMPASIMCIVQRPLQPKLGFDLTIPSINNSTTMGLPTTALQVQPLTRYLLNYYNTQVADLMTVIPLTENPWKTVYFPRALMAIGELLALGKTSNAKNALLNALLAVLAFNLQSKFPKNSDPMKYYLNLGIRLRNQASLFVKSLLGSNIDSKSGIESCVLNEKYKDVLCAVMSMISVDLVWGTMQDTNLYIRWCGKVITAKMVNKKKLSSRARILHRIFLSLKLIQDLTCLDLDNIKDDYETINESGYDVNGDKFFNTLRQNSKSSGKGKIEFIVNNVEQSNIAGNNQMKNTSPLFVNKKLINTKKNDENFATDALYGLPNSLILLFSETVQLLRTKIYHQEIYQDLPINFQQAVNNLEEKLLNWRLDWKLFETDNKDVNDIKAQSERQEEPDEESTRKQDEVDKKFTSPMHEATYHHILSFYYALTIYFNRLINAVPPEEVQPKVEKTLEHLNAIQALIAKDEAAIIPLFWQGFIAGCEATSNDLQMGFKKWGADIAQYLGSYWGARQIMLEVWRRKRMNEPRDDWVSVIRDWEMNLMLN